MLKILFWGTGSYSINWIEKNKTIFNKISFKKFISKEHIIGNKDEFFGYPIISPSEIFKEEYDYICIMSSFVDEIKKEAIEKLFIPKDLLITVKELTRYVIGTLYILDNNHYVDAEKLFEKRILLNTLTDMKEPENIFNDYYDYIYLKNKYGFYADSYTPLIGKKEYNQEKIIWTCWLQGFENAPKLVQACLNSIKYKMPNYKVILITEQNYEKYVQFPSYVIEKYKNGIITKTHLSDLLRLELLIRYGGIWIDATVMLFSPIPVFIQDAELFMFDFNRIKGLEPRTISSWFIVAKPENNILILTKKMLYQYWRENNYLFNYYLLHYFIRISSERLANEWQKYIHIVGNTEILQNKLFNELNEEDYKIIKKLSFCQKLSYKIPIPDKTINTYYEIILKENLRFE